MKTIKELSSYIIDNIISSLFSEILQILTACIICLSLPVTIVSAEHSYPKLKLITNYLRNSISQERFTNISILNRARTD